MRRTSAISAEAIFQLLELSFDVREPLFKFVDAPFTLIRWRLLRESSTRQGEPTHANQYCSLSFISRSLSAAPARWGGRRGRRGEEAPRRGHSSNRSGN